MTAEEEREVSQWVRNVGRGLKNATEIRVSDRLFLLLKERCVARADCLGEDVLPSSGKLFFRGVPVVVEDESMPEPDLIIKE